MARPSPRKNLVDILHTNHTWVGPKFSTRLQFVQWCMEEESTTINQELDHVFLLFPQRRCGFLFGTWSAKKNHRDRSSYHKAKILLQREMQKPENFWHTTRSMQHRVILKWLNFFRLLQLLWHIRRSQARDKYQISYIHLNFRYIHTWIEYLSNFVIIHWWVLPFICCFHIRYKIQNQAFLVICRSVKLMLKLQLKLKAEAKMHKIRG